MTGKAEHFGLQCHFELQNLRPPQPYLPLTVSGKSPRGKFSLELEGFSLLPGGRGLVMRAVSPWLLQVPYPSRRKPGEAKDTHPVQGILGYLAHLSVPPKASLAS